MLAEVIAAASKPDEQGRRRPESLHGSLKSGLTCNDRASRWPAAPVERIRWNNGWVGVTRAERVRTTIGDPAADRAPDLVNRQLRVCGPNELFFADVTYVPMDTGCSPAPRS